MENKISIQELRVLTDNFFDNIEKDFGASEIPIRQSMYWHVLPDEKYDVNNDPKQLGIGNLRDDLEFLKNILNDKEKAVLPNLYHLAAILDYLSNGIDTSNQ